MTEFLEILKYILPSLVLLVAVYFMLREFFKNNRERFTDEIKLANQKVVTPIRLQAYERIILLLERILPGSIVLRINQPDMTAFQLQTALIKTIREEFEHNLSQQLYVSYQAWELVKNAKEEMIKLVNTASTKVDDKATATDLAKIIFEISLEKKHSTADIAIEFVKNEIRKTF